MRRLNVGALRGPDHLAPAGRRRGATVRPTAAIMARFLSGLSVIALEAIAKTSEPFQPKPGQTGPAFSLAQSRHGRSVRPFFLTQGLPRHQKRLEEIFGATCARIANTTRTAFVVAGKLVERR